MSILGIAIARPRVWLTCISACLVLALVTSPAEAQTQEQIDWCMNKGNSFSVDLRIGGCTASIRSGRWSGKGLAWAFNNRCWAYNDQKDFDLALVDCDQAIRLDSQQAHAFNNRGNSYNG